MSYTKKIVVGLSGIFLMMTIANLFGYLLRVLLARSLSPSEYGLLYAVFALFGMFSFMQSLGLTDGLVRFIAAAKPKKRKELLVTVLYTQFLSTLLITFIVVLLSPWLAQNYFHNGLAVQTIIIYGFSVLISPIDATFIALFIGMGRTMWYGYIALIRAVILLAATAALLPVAGVLALPLAYVIAALGSTVLLLLGLLRIWPGFFALRVRMRLKHLWPLLRFGIPLLLAATVSGLFAYSDVLILTYFRSLTEVGLYNVAIPTASLMWFIGTVVYSVLYPVSSEMNAKKQLHVLQDGIGRMYLYAFILSLPFVAVFLLFPGTVINALFGAQYIDAAVALQLLIIGGFIFTLNNINAGILSGLGKSKEILNSLLISLVLNIVLDLVLVPPYGIVGSAISTLCAFLLLFILNFKKVKIAIPFSLDFSRIGLSILATAVFSFSIIVLRTILHLPQWWKIGVAVVCGGIVYVLLLFALKIISVKEIENIKKLVLGR